MELNVILGLMSLACVYTVSEAVSCHICSRYEVLDIPSGDNEDHCEEVTDHTPKTAHSNCDFCVMETFDTKGFDYIKRYCWEKEEECKTGKVKLAFSDVKGLKEATEYTVDRECCAKDNCNNEYWNADSASSLHLTGSLCAAILFSIYFNLRK